MINVVDRVPTYPNRIKLKPVSGQENVYDWERADEPTVAGTPINKALFDSILDGIALNKGMTVYVSPAGTDELGNGTAANSYRTINKAINSIPKNLNGFDVTINIAAGTYDEDVLIARTFGGNVVLSGTVDSSVSVRSLRVSYGSAVRVQNIALTVTGGFNGNAIAVTSASLICTSKLAVNGNVENGMYINFDGFVYTVDIAIDNTTYAAINATNRSSMYAGNVSGAATSGMFARSANGSLLAYNVMEATAQALLSTTAGGRILSGAQTSIPNY